MGEIIHTLLNLQPAISIQTQTVNMQLQVFVCSKHLRLKHSLKKKKVICEDDNT